MYGLAQWTPGPGGPDLVRFAATNPRTRRPLPAPGSRTHREAA
ncbi:hypothetical protein APR08_001617 [Nocardia amikacinitolerans]|nr:hypothetical protein [Nocardia amikacinitolerans]